MASTPEDQAAPPTRPLRTQRRPRVVGIVVNSGRSEARELAGRAVARLTDEGLRVLGYEGDHWPRGSVETRSAAEFASELDVAVVFGGDGTLLRAAWLARDRGVPLIGINLGRLGFLSEADAADADAALTQVCEGRFSVEERMTLEVVVRDADGAEVDRGWALNEASIERVSPQRLVVFEVRVGPTTLAHVPADAVICATPTGSTAYAFSARGPILSPALDAILLVPVAPHSLFDRTLVVGAAETLVVAPRDGVSEVAVGLDGRESLPIPHDGWVEVARAEQPVRMVRLGSFDFYARVRDKFGLR